MRFTRVFNEILMPIFIITLFAVMISLLVDCYGFISIFDLCTSFDTIIQIEIFLLTILITVLTIRIALIDTELKTIREKINKIFDDYGYYGHLLFEEQIDVRINDFYNEIQKRIEAQIKIKETILDKKKVVGLQKHYYSLKKYRQDHIDSIKPITILIVILIIACLILSIFNLNDSIVTLLTLKLAVISMTVYTIYKTLFAALYILINPFTEND
jgi:small-conductance mechanosensitive channel